MASNEGRLTTPVGDLGAVAWQAQWAQVPGVSFQLCKSGVVHHRTAVWAGRRSVL